MQNSERERDFFKRLSEVIPAERLLRREPLSNHTTFKIGGPADYFITPATVEEVAAAVHTANRFEVPYTVIGNGSNLLVLDKGLRGLVVKFGPHMNAMRRENDRIIVGAGALLREVSRYAATQCLSGLEFAIGIPGNIGGAVYMNAGAYDGDMSRVVGAVTAVEVGGAIVRYSREDMPFAYRHSLFQDNGSVICEAELLLQEGETGAIEDKMHDYTERREAKQPLEMPCAGSTFKRPPGHFAGTLIEQAGLKGLSVGGAQISCKHAGFIINAGGATAQDVLDLISEVQRRVLAYAGVALEPEVRVVGEA